MDRIEELDTPTGDDTISIAASFDAAEAHPALALDRFPVVQAPALAISARTRPSIFHDRVIDAGAKAFTVYNHMLLPAVFDTLESDYWHLREHVQVWDVAAERQVRLKGPDARKLAQLMTPRDLRKLTPGRCLYAPLVDASGGMINDPILIGVSDDEVWVSIADSDVLLWAQGLAAGYGLNVSIDEPDVSPLAVQGPKSDALMARVFGSEIVNLKKFRWAYFPFAETELLIARSGWSHQGGFEIYVHDGALGEPLWDALFAAGQDLSVRAGCPNLIERIESGLLSYGNDMTRADTPLMCGLESFCDLDADVSCLAADALQSERQNGPKSRIRGLHFQAADAPSVTRWWQVAVADKHVGTVRSAAWSPRLQSYVAIAMIDTEHAALGNAVEVHVPGSSGSVRATVVSLPMNDRAPVPPSSR